MGNISDSFRSNRLQVRRHLLLPTTRYGRDGTRPPSVSCSNISANSSSYNGRPNFPNGAARRRSGSIVEFAFVTRLPRRSTRVVRVCGDSATQTGPGRATKPTDSERNGNDKALIDYARVGSIRWRRDAGSCRSKGVLDLAATLPEKLRQQRCLFSM